MNISFFDALQKIQSLTRQPFTIMQIDDGAAVLNLHGMTTFKLRKAILWLIREKEIPSGKVELSDHFVYYKIKTRRKL